MKIWAEYLEYLEYLESWTRIRFWAPHFASSSQRFATPSQPKEFWLRIKVSSLTRDQRNQMDSISDSIGCHTVTTQQSMIGKCLERDEDVRHAGKTSVATRRKKNLQNVCSSMQTSYPQCLFFMCEDLPTRYTRNASILFTSWDSRDMCKTCLFENAWKQLKLHRPQRKIKNWSTWTKLK